VGAAAIAAGALGLASLGGCGSDPLPYGRGGIGGGGAVAAGDAAGSFGFDGSSLAPPGCGVGPDGGVCDCIDSPLLVDPPNFYFVLDRSGSMVDEDKWMTVRTAVIELMTAIGPRASFGATAFPGQAGGCAPGTEVMSLRRGDSPSGAIGPTTKTLADALWRVPSGGTPTAGTLAALADRLPKVAGKTYVILATDGGPNCGQQSCGADACILNIERINGCTPTGAPCCADSPSLCLDSDATVAAVAKLKAGGVPTFVIGVPGSQAYAPLLDRLAITGGTRQPTGSTAYYRVDKADKADLTAALRQVAARIVATCTYELKEAPPDSNRVNVYLDEVAVPKSGWTLSGKTVTLIGDTCARVMRGDVMDVRIILGCPTIEAR